MLKNTSLTKATGIKFPIIQAPMAGGATTPELVAAVSNAGGLGSLGAGYMKPIAIQQAIQKIRRLTNKPFAVNLFVPEDHQVDTKAMQKACEVIEQCCHELDIKIQSPVKPYLPVFEEQINSIIEEKAPVFSFTFGNLDAASISKLKANQTILIGTATTLEEAKVLEENKIDFVVAQGCEAGGHRGTFLGEAENSLVGLFSLLPQCVDDLKVPVIAAGGIMDGRGIAAAITLGACAVQMGTAFLGCPESGIHKKYKQTLLGLKQDNTILTRAFSGKLARGLQNIFIERMKHKKENTLPYPIQNELTRTMREKAKQQSNTDFMSMWAGQSAQLSRGISAGDLINCLVTEVEAIFKNK